MPQNTSCLLALVLAVGSALVAMPSQAQTATETNRDITVVSSQSDLSQDIISNLKKSKAVNQNKAINISQAEPSSTAANPLEDRENAIHSRIGWLKQ